MAEDKTQQKLADAKTEIADLKQKVAKLEQELELSRGDVLELEAANKKLEAAAGSSSGDGDKKELAFRLLWQVARLPKCATVKEATQALPQFRQWVGEKRAEELEAAWRKGAA